MTPIEVVQTVYEAMAARDIDTLLPLIHTEFVLTQDAALPWGGRHVGHEGFANFGLALTSSIDSAVTTHEMFMADGDVVQVGHTRNGQGQRRALRHRRGPSLDDPRRTSSRRSFLDRHRSHAACPQLRLSSGPRRDEWGKLPSACRVVVSNRDASASGA